MLHFDCQQIISLGQIGGLMRRRNTFIILVLSTICLLSACKRDITRRTSSGTLTDPGTSIVSNKVSVPKSSETKDNVLPEDVTDMSFEKNSDPKKYYYLWKKVYFTSNQKRKLSEIPSADVSLYKSALAYQFARNEERGLSNSEIRYVIYVEDSEIAQEFLKNISNSSKVVLINSIKAQEDPKEYALYMSFHKFRLVGSRFSEVACVREGHRGQSKLQVSHALGELLLFKIVNKQWQFVKILHEWH
jgi:hypothetical protein